ncbi:hypothetical protein CCR75_000773 [Bremia lactucae]|uniref:Uncharacterized protein n=1 Tax=Bremia lactucae TaxID=4779 RepID=A0A976IHZ8_BRELC|nr:hypothetical protein CCR75_000773 [Bremia lactucae]
MQTLAAKNETLEYQVQNCGIFGHFLAKTCPFETILPITRCAVSTSEVPMQTAIDGVLWAEDGQSATIPEPILRRHGKRETLALFCSAYRGHNIHRLRVVSTTYRLFILPCRGVVDTVPRFLETNGALTDMTLCPATEGAVMKAWLEQEAAPVPETFSITAIVLLILIILPSTVLALVV